MATTPLYVGSNPSATVNYETCLYMVLSHVSLTLSMRLSFASVVGEFLWLAMTFTAFLVVFDIHQACFSEFAVTVMPALYIDLASH